MLAKSVLRLIKLTFESVPLAVKLTFPLISSKPSIKELKSNF